MSRLLNNDAPTAAAVKLARRVHAPRTCSLPLSPAPAGTTSATAIQSRFRRSVCAVPGSMFFRVTFGFGPALTTVRLPAHQGLPLRFSARYACVQSSASWIDSGPSSNSKDDANFTAFLNTPLAAAACSLLSLFGRCAAQSPLCTITMPSICYQSYLSAHAQHVRSWRGLP